ncbi:predicted protein [Naegleria gruberi]|uniref:Predicted protein n=1 Tax=Naegleria gruberi TaxID=5762 RepID=D2VTT5_NAEGR|nr:uncharacterized protein NAEGRDRAFT_52195 [Naegleria gruberi]EFC39782.1 predicted protein [Naegleria gruberi]|eukprot:XP_002672526.1 predicted protein [Naegleria gruberi strain NEG-M]
MSSCPHNHQFNNDELSIITSFMHPCVLLINIQLVSKNFQLVIETHENYWKMCCEKYFNSGFFKWEEDLPFQVEKCDEFSSFHYKLFVAWSKSIPRILKVGRLPILSNNNCGSEHERSIFERYDPTRYATKHLTQLVILLNVFSLTKFRNNFYGHLENVNSFYRDFQSYDDKSDEESLLVDVNSEIIFHNLPFGAFCLMILSPNQSEKIKLVETLLMKQLPDETKDGADLVLSVSSPNPTNVSEEGVVSYFNSMTNSTDTRWTDDRDYGWERSWLPCSGAGFVTIYSFEEKKELKQVSMDRNYFYP